MSLSSKPRRGSLVIVNFEQGGAFIPPEMTKSGRPCVVIDADDLRAITSGVLYAIDVR